jgi:hypothetical protein
LAPTLGPSEHSDAHPSCEGRPKLFAAFQIVYADDLRCQDRIRGLSVSADDQRISYGFEPPTGRNALNLARRVVAVAAGADQRRVGTPADAVQSRIVGPVEEILHGVGTRTASKHTIKIERTGNRSDKA